MAMYMPTNDQKVLELEGKMDKLAKVAMKGKWKDVIEMYREDRRLRDAKITALQDTALHMAVTDGNEKVVSELVDLASKGTLEVVNERLNTPLHLAASRGNVGMCRKICNVHHFLVNARNVDGETPLFLAALHGHMKAFIWLHKFSSRYGDVYTLCRRKNGDTILHCAIIGQHFELAFVIIHLYKDLVKAAALNEEGLTPLHLVASMPSAFRSCNHLGPLDYLIYHCIQVEKLKGPDMQEPDMQHVNLKEHKPSFTESALNLIHKFVGKRENANANDPEEGIYSTTAAGGSEAHGHGRANRYRIWYVLVKYLYLLLLVILGQVIYPGWSKINDIRKKKEIYTWSVQITDELIAGVEEFGYLYSDEGRNPQEPIGDDVPQGLPGQLGSDLELEKKPERTTLSRATFLLTAAKNGVMEVVERILESFPRTIDEVNEEHKNIVLLAAENRQPKLYELLKNKGFLKESLFRLRDVHGNTALHLAAKLSGKEEWHNFAGEALQMQWEVKWFKYVKDSMPRDVFLRPCNHTSGDTPEQIFKDTHAALAKGGAKWLDQVSQACSVVSTLVATVAFATSTALPGSVKEDTGHPNLENEPTFRLFAVSSLIALCSSLTSTVMFLSILTSRYQMFAFEKDLPRKLIIGLTSLFLAIASMWVTFCAGHFFELKGPLQKAALPVYLLTSFPVILFVFSQFPLYFDLMWATFTTVPAPNPRPIPAIEYVPEKRSEEDNGFEVGKYH